MDRISFDRETSVEDGNNAYGNSRTDISFLGLNWRWRWGSRGYSNTSISNTYNDYHDSFDETVSNRHLYHTDSRDRAVQLRNENHYRINQSQRVKFGLEARRILDGYHYFIAEDQDEFGQVLPELHVDHDPQATKLGLFGDWIWSPLPQLETNLGVRYDYFSYNGNLHISPRLSLTWRLNERSSLSAAAGIYYQNLPLILLSHNPLNKDLNDPLAYHLVLGFNRLLTANTRLTVEVYNKEYHDFPLDPLRPQLFPADNGASPNALSSGGRAFCRGVEVVLQKKLATDFYGLVSGTLFQSRYRGWDQLWRDRVFGNRYIFSLEGGYIASRKWEYRLRWILAGGRPYTPFDLEASHQANSGIYDQTRINSLHYASYHALNVRVDRRFNFKNSNLIVYMDIWNTYARKNIFVYYWNEVDNKQDREDQWGMMPIGGLEWEF